MSYESSPGERKKFSKALGVVLKSASGNLVHVETPSELLRITNITTGGNQRIALDGLRQMKHSGHIKVRRDRDRERGVRIYFTGKGREAYGLKTK